MALKALRRSTRHRGYFQVGKPVVTRFADSQNIWDGKSAAGVGGTGDIILMRLRRWKE